MVLGIPHFPKPPNRTLSTRNFDLIRKNVLTANVVLTVLQLLYIKTNIGIHLKVCTCFTDNWGGTGYTEVNKQYSIIYIYTFVRMHVRIYVRMYVDTYIRTCVHAYIHTCMHTYIHTACMHAHLHGTHILCVYI